jgi:glycosyltransferase involved in cell wall biosynthesis
MKKFSSIIQNFLRGVKKIKSHGLLIRKYSLMRDRINFSSYFTWRRIRTQEVICALQGKKVRNSVKSFMQQLQPNEAWHSWDSTPWAHPWLSTENLVMSRSYEKSLLESLSKKVSNIDSRTKKYAFVGNLANNMALRALPLRANRYNIDIFLHPQDNFLLSQPGWEISDQIAPEGTLDYQRLRAQGFELPEVPGVYSCEANDASEIIITLARNTLPKDWTNQTVPARYFRQLDILRWPSYAYFSSYVTSFQRYDALFTAQTPYLAYLSQRPYLAAQTGGDLWFDAARNDELGQLTRQSYSKAQAILATNPWAYANARRYGFKHVIYAPLIIDTTQYSPAPRGAGTSELRELWKKEVGGDFFVFSSARIDLMWKGSDIGLEGFCRFAKKYTRARLVVTAWGENRSALIEIIKRQGLENRVIFLPLAGKRKLVECLRAVDCLLDQFKIGYYGATALEAMSCGVPVVMRILKPQYDALCPTGAPPVLNVNNAEEVFFSLERLAVQPGLIQQIARESRDWILKNHDVNVWESTYGVLLAATAAKIPFDFRGAPLNMPLSLEEIEYHGKNLTSAPPFPDYVI